MIRNPAWHLEMLTCTSTISKVIYVTAFDTIKSPLHRYEIHPNVYLQPWQYWQNRKWVSYDSHFYWYLGQNTVCNLRYGNLRYRPNPNSRPKRFQSGMLGTGLHVTYFGMPSDRMDFPAFTDTSRLLTPAKLDDFCSSNSFSRFCGTVTIASWRFPQTGNNGEYS